MKWIAKGDKIVAAAHEQTPAKKRSTIKDKVLKYTCLGLGSLFTLHGFEYARLKNKPPEPIIRSAGAARVFNAAANLGTSIDTTRLAGELEKLCREFAKSDRIAGQLIREGFAVKLVDCNTHERTPGLSCSSIGTNIFQIDSALAPRLLHAVYAKDNLKLDLNGRTRVFAAHIFPLIVSAKYQQETLYELRKLGISSYFIGSSELVAAALVREDAAAALAHKNLDSHERMHACLHARANCEWLRGLPEAAGSVRDPEALSRLLQQQWKFVQGATFASTPLNPEQSVHLLALWNNISTRLNNFTQPEFPLKGSAALHSMISTHLSEAQKLASGAQRLLLEGKCESAFRYARGEASTDNVRFQFISCYAVQSEDRLALALSETARAVSAANSVPCKLPVLGEQLLEQGLIRIEEILANRVSASSGTLRATNWGSIDILIHLCAGSASVLRNVSEKEKLSHQGRTRLTRALESLVFAGLNSLNLKATDNYERRYNLIPGVFAALDILERNGLSKPEFLKSCSKALEHHSELDLEKELRDALGPRFERLAPAISMLNARERGWLSVWCNGGTLNDWLPTICQPHTMALPSVGQQITSPPFLALTVEAQCAALRSLCSQVDGLPRRRVMMTDPCLALRPISMECAIELTELLSCIKDLTAKQASLFVEAFYLVPQRERFSLEKVSSSNFSVVDNQLLYLLGSSARSCGPMREALRYLSSTRTDYRDPETAAFLRDKLTRAFPNIAWAENVSVLTASGTHQLAWSSVYDNRVLAQLKPGRTLIDAQHVAQQELKDYGVVVTHPVRWATWGTSRVLEGKLGAISLDIGNHLQNPQLHYGQVLPKDGPRYALILYGDNYLRDLWMNFAREAGKWNRTLAQSYGCKSTERRVESDSQLEAEFKAFCAQNIVGQDVAIIVIGHGGSSPGITPGPHFQTSGSAEQGSVSLKNKYNLSEAVLKSMVNRHLAPFARSVTVCVTACHSGSFEE